MRRARVSLRCMVPMDSPLTARSNSAACGGCELRGLATSAACSRCVTEQLLTGAPPPPLRARRSERGRAIAIACLVATAACWGSAFRFTEIALTDLAPLELTFVRCLIGAVVVGAIAAATRPPAQAAFSSPPRAAWRALLVGGICTAIANTSVSIGQVGATSTTAGVILGTVPVWTALLALAVAGAGAQRARPSRRLVCALVLGTSAAALPAAFAPAAASPWAVGLLLVAALAHAGSMVSIRPAVMRFGPLRSTAGVIAVAVLLLVPAWIAGPTPSMPPLPVVASVLVLGLLPTGLAYVTFYEAVRRLGARTAALAVYLTPAVALLVGWLSDPRLVGAVTLLSAACGIAAVAIGVVDGATARSAIRRLRPTPRRVGSRPATYPRLHEPSNVAIAPDQSPVP